MKKKKVINNLFYFLLGGIVLSSFVVFAATSLQSNSILYDNSTSGGTSTNVQGSLDELYEKASNAGVPIDPDTFRKNTKKTVYASSKGVCIERNNKLNCFKINNFEEEKEHIQQVFSDISCRYYSVDFQCEASDFSCAVNAANGSVACLDLSDGSNCVVYGNGSISCR